MQKYRARLSGPLLDRIDLMISVPSLSDTELQEKAAGESSAIVRQRVVAARERQMTRQGKANAALSPAEVDRHCLPDAAGAQLLKQAIARLSLSARAYHRILRVARSIADLGDVENILSPHIAEAVHYRRGLGNA